MSATKATIILLCVVCLLACLPLLAASLVEARQKRRHRNKKTPTGEHNE